MAYIQPSSPFAKLRKTTTGKGRHFLKAKEGAGMTAKGRAAYNKETGGDLKAPQPGGGKRRTSYCARSKGQMKCITSIVLKLLIKESAQHAADGNANKQIKK